MENISRRSLISAGLGAGLVAALPGTHADPAAAVSTADDAGLRTDPFMLGIASGEPWPDGFVIWTRLAVNPVAEDGLGGMPSRNVAVAWEVAEDAGMRRVVARGVEHARIETAHSVHVELRGLRPGREYFYRFRTGRHVSDVGPHADQPGTRTRRRLRWPWRSPAAPSTSTATSLLTSAWPRTTRTWCCTWATTSTSTRRTAT